MQILKNYDLTELNTFKIKALAKFFVEVSSEVEFIELSKTSEFKENEKLFLGNGSNILFTKDFDGLIILNKLKGIQIFREDVENVYIKAKAGEKWNDLVNFVIFRNYWGIENLTLIPGSVGAAPVQNIGAYGVEVKDIIENIETLDINSGEKKIFSKEECKFNYRESVFKNELKGKYFITAVIFKLNKKENKNLRYKALEEYLTQKNIKADSPINISKAVAEIRQSKLPDPKILGNAGSFFKNVYVNEEKLLELQKKYPEIPFFKEENRIKISTAWLIESCGWKGKKIGSVGVYEKQALVLVNYGGSTGKEIMDLVNQIIDSVSEKFGLKITLEVNLI